MNRIVGYTIAACCIFSGCNVNNHKSCYVNYPFEKKKYSPYYDDAIWQLYKFNFDRIRRDTLHQYADNITQLELQPTLFQVKNDTISFYFSVIVNGKDLTNKFWSGVAFDPKATEKIQLLVNERRWFTFMTNEESSEFAYFVKNNRDSLPDVLECLAKKKGVW